MCKNKDKVLEFESLVLGWLDFLAQDPNLNIVNAHELFFLILCVP